MNRKSSLNRYSHAHDEADINLTPMLDVVFILLIFFIITTSFVQETGINVSLASVQSATPQEAPIRVGIDKHNEVWIRNQAIDLRTLQSMIRKIHLQNPQSSVVVFADKASANAVLVKVLDQIHRAGIKNIAIAAELDE